MCSKLERGRKQYAEASCWYERKSQMVKVQQCYAGDIILGWQEQASSEHLLKYVERDRIMLVFALVPNLVGN